MVCMRRIVTCLCLLALSLAPGGAHEPDGRTILRYDWAPSSGARGGVRVLRLWITAAVPMRDLKLSLEGRTAFQLKGRGFSGSGKVLGDLARGESAKVEFDVVVPVAGGGIVAFKVEGTTLD